MQLSSTVLNALDISSSVVVAITSQDCFFVWGILSSLSPCSYRGQIIQLAPELSWPPLSSRLTDDIVAGCCWYRVNIHVGKWHFLLPYFGRSFPLWFWQKNRCISAAIIITSLSVLLWSALMISRQATEKRWCCLIFLFYFFHKSPLVYFFHHPEIKVNMTAYTRPRGPRWYTLFCPKGKRSIDKSISLFARGQSSWHLVQREVIAKRVILQGVERLTVSGKVLAIYLLYCQHTHNETGGIRLTNQLADLWKIFHLQLSACSKSKRSYFKVERNCPNTTQKTITGFPEKSIFEKSGLFLTHFARFLRVVFFLVRLFSCYITLVWFYL